MTTTTQYTAPTGLWLPLITPFRDGALDETSLRRLVRHYAAQPVDGLILAATTGEAMTLNDDETRRLAEVAAQEARETGWDAPIWLGLAGSDTRRLVARLDETAAWPVDGYLVTCPSYTRPSQDGLVRHFEAVAGATARPVMVYNIPYRTGVNLGNDAMLRLAALPNVVGVKDCCVDARQTFDLIRQRPAGFSVLTGEDAGYYDALALGGDGAILATAHADTAAFANVRARFVAGDQPGALAAWRGLADLTRLFFAEPSPSPIKHWLWRDGLIDSPEVRLPMVPVSDSLAARLDAARLRAAA